MGSRRAPARVWGLGGRVGGDHEEDGPVWTPGPTSRSYLLSIRPETRSTFCSIIAQLTEETQPLFETTLKSRAVSEDSDVRFTCIVTGYPEPEVTWYKDDVELDRYCGLPKYEITHQGNRHTLQLYRCREEDAAIYQASARNSKGIVSCSGVLEVGTMTEYKIHQRWFAKLKRKAAAKMREIEQSWRQGREATEEADALRKLSPDRFQRKRRLSGAQAPAPSAPGTEAKDQTPAAWQEGETESTQHPGLGLINSFAPGEAPTNGEPAPENGEDGEHGLLTYICEAMELGSQRAPQKESGAKKKRKDDSKPSLQKPESEQAQSHHSSENGVPSSDKPDSRGTQGPVDTERVQIQPGSRAARRPGSPGRDGTRKPASAGGSLVQAPVPAPGPSPDQEVRFSLKDMYLETTQAARPPGEEAALSPRVQAPGESALVKVPVVASREGVSTAPSSAPQPSRPFNRKRFAPPRPKGEPTTDSKPGSLNQASEHGVQSSGKAPPQASAQVPTPPARHRHSTRDSPLQGRAGHRTPGEASEPHVPPAPALSAGSSSDAAPAGCSSPGRQGIPEPMDTEAQEDRSTPTDGRTGGQKDAQADGKMQVDGRMQGDRKAQAEAVTQGREDPRASQPDGSSQKDTVMQRRLETQVGRTQAGERTQKDARVQGAGTPPVDSVPVATKGQSQQQPVTSLRPPEHPGSPWVTEYFTQTPDESRIPEKPCFTLRPEEPTVTASGNPEDTELGPPLGNLTCSAPLPPQGSLEQVGGEKGQGLAKATLEDSPCQCPKEEQPGGVLLVDQSGPSQGAPAAPFLPGPGLTHGPQEGAHSAPASQPLSTAASQPSGDQALPSSAPTLHLGPGPPTQSPLVEGACAKEPDVERKPPGAQSCDPGLIDSLKNYLLLLLKLSSAEAGGAEAPGGAAPGAVASSCTLAPTVEVAGLSPRTSRRILERVENNHLVQSAQSLLLSPRTSRRLTGLLDREVQAGQQALATAQGSRGPSPLTVPAIVVGEEGPGLAPEAPGVGEGPGPWGAARELGTGGPLGQAGRPAADSRAQEPLPEEALGETPAGLPAATPEELALGARRKRFLPKVRAAADGESSRPEEKESPTVSPRGPRKSLAPGSPGTPRRERRSPTQGRKAGMLEVPRPEEELPAGDPGCSPKAGVPNTEPTPDETKQEAPAKPKTAKDLLKAPQVIRKIRVEQFPDASGSLKLWCQFFNVLSDSVLTWAKDQHPVGEVARSAGDEGPAALAIVHACPADCGVYRCTIHNEHGSASTDFSLSPEVLSGFVSREEGEVGEEIEMTPMVFAKGLADSGCWGDKLFGRLVSEERGGGHGCGLRKASQAKVIYGLEPIFESGRTCIIKVSSLLVFGPSSETSLLGRNYDVTIQVCKIQNMSREYCKIFAAEARAAPGFGEVPEIIPLYLIYRPANNIPYATLEEDLGKPLESYCSREWGHAGAPAAASSPEALQKCQTFQHWLYQWTNGSFLVTDLAGADWKMTDVQIATKLRGYQGLKESCLPALLDQFASSHQCNTYCELLGLTPLKGPEAAHPQAKPKGSKSPSAGRKGPQLSPQPQKKGLPSPQGARKSAPGSKAAPPASGEGTVQLLGQPPMQEVGSKAQGRW